MTRATSPRLTARALIRRVIAVPDGSAFQMAFRADCISPNTPEAVKIKVIRPTKVASVPDT